MSDQKHGVSTLAQGTFATAEGRSNGFRARNCEGRWPPRDPPGAYRGFLEAWWWISCDMWVDMSGRLICYIWCIYILYIYTHMKKERVYINILIKSLFITSNRITFPMLMKCHVEMGMHRDMI